MQWEHHDGDREIVRRALNTSKDRRVHVAQYGAEVSEHCILSAVQVRPMMNTRGISDGLELAAGDLRAVFTVFVEAMGSDDAGNRLITSAPQRRRLRSGRWSANAWLCADHGVPAVGRLEHVIANRSDWFFLNFSHGNDDVAHVPEE